MAISHDENRFFPIKSILYLWTMRFLLMIPMLALLLSNIPIKVELTIPAEVVQKCCSKKQSQKMKCAVKHNRNKKICCSKKESTCVTFSCFQVSANAPQPSLFNFQLANEPPQYAIFHLNSWTNPFINQPGQPPDTV